MRYTKLSGALVLSASLSMLAQTPNPIGPGGVTPSLTAWEAERIENLKLQQQMIATLQQKETGGYAELVQEFEKRTPGYTIDQYGNVIGKAAQATPQTPAGATNGAVATPDSGAQRAKQYNKSMRPAPSAPPVTPPTK